MKKMLCRAGLLIFCLCLSCLPEAESAWQPEIRIGLQAGPSLELVVSRRSVVKAGRPGALAAQPVCPVPAGGKLTVSCQKDMLLTVNGKSLRASYLEVLPAEGGEQNGRFTAGRSAYRGIACLQLDQKRHRLNLINRLPVEAYLYGVVPKEMSAAAPAEAVKAQCVAARTFALAHRKRHAGEGYDVCASTHCQAYQGLSAEQAASNRYVDMTCGEVLDYAGKLIEAVYHTDAGGMTEDCAEVWGSNIPYLSAVRDADRYTLPWHKEVKLTDFMATLQRAAKKDIGQLQRIELSRLQPLGSKQGKDRTTSGRVRRATFIGSKGSAQLNGNQLRSLYGLRSTLFSLTLKKDAVAISGYGWGHGLGMSQTGAQRLSAQHDYKEILAHYYWGASLKKLY